MSLQPKNPKSLQAYKPTSLQAYKPTSLQINYHLSKKNLANVFLAFGEISNG